MDIVTGVILMEYNSKSILEKIYTFTLGCGKFQDPKRFAIESLPLIADLCTFDRATIYFFDANGRVSGQYLTDSDKHWSSLYIEYYSKVEGERYGLSLEPEMNLTDFPLYPIDWSLEPESEFVTDFIKPRGITHSVGIILCDLNGIRRSMICLDRKSGVVFSKEEITALSMAAPIMKDLYKNFYYAPSAPGSAEQIAWETAELTSRETEVAHLLCQGFTSANISKMLHIAPTTVAKHIAHIYKKLQISSRQDLLLRMLK